MTKLLVNRHQTNSVAVFHRPHCLDVQPRGPAAAATGPTASGPAATGPAARPTSVHDHKGQRRNAVFSMKHSLERVPPRKFILPTLYVRARPHAHSTCNRFGFFILSSAHFFMGHLVPRAQDFMTVTVQCACSLTRARV